MYPLASYVHCNCRQFICLCVMLCLILLTHTQRGLSGIHLFSPTAQSSLSSDVIAGVVMGTIIGLGISAFFCGILVAGL